MRLFISLIEKNEQILIHENFSYNSEILIQKNGKYFFLEQISYRNTPLSRG